MKIQHEFLPHEITRPEPPKPFNFAFRSVVPQEELRFARSIDERRYLFEQLKRRAAHELALSIAEHCKWFDASMPMNGDLALQLEVTINDKGAYKNWIPRAEQEGRAEGWARAMSAAARSLPYGIADAASEFYD
jgi:hypothetical protein